MKILTVILALSLSTYAFADDHKKGMDGEKLSTAKAKMIEAIDARISALENHKTCVNSAADKNALMECRKKMKDFHAGQKEKRQEMRKNIKEKRKNK